MESSLRAVCCVAKEPGIYIDRWPEDDYISTVTHTTVNQIDRGLSDFIQGFSGPGGQHISVSNRCIGWRNLARYARLALRDEESMLGIQVAVSDARDPCRSRLPFCHRFP